MSGYTRQSAAKMVTGEIIYAADHNAEFNQLQSAFDGVSGHAHDGSTGNAPKINLTTSVTGVLPFANGGLNSALQSIGGLTTFANQMIYTTDSNLYSTTSLTPFARTILDDTDASTVRATLGLGSLSVQNSGTVNITGGSITGITDLAIADGGTGASTVANAISNLQAVSYGNFQSLSESQKGQALDNINANYLSGFRNKLINGNFDIWQRGLTFNNPSDLTYTADRWMVRRDVPGTFSVFATNNGANLVPGVPTYYISWIQGTSATATYRALVQRIENVRTMAGKRITVSFIAWADGPRQLKVRMNQDFGSGGSSNVVSSSQTVNLTSTVTRYSVVFDIPSVVDKTIGSGSFLELLLDMPLTGTFTINLSRVSLVEGDATAITDPFEPRHIQQELNLCQRYAWATTATGFVGVVQTGVGATVCSKSTPVTMRTKPTLSIIGGDGNFAFGDGGTSVTFNSIASNSSTEDCIQFRPGAPVSGSFSTAQVPVIGLYSTGNAFILANAEL